mmetsp:Transcript_29824/g.67250  ORF Transcript_29824/g.67250 Transcript_29824/m.67250 type:complete len:102 (+) Transcript_29824:456-761(+)
MLAWLGNASGLQTALPTIAQLPSCKHLGVTRFGKRLHSFGAAMEHLPRSGRSWGKRLNSSLPSEPVPGKSVASWKRELRGNMPGRLLPCMRTSCNSVRDAH